MNLHLKSHTDFSRLHLNTFKSMIAKRELIMNQSPPNSIMTDISVEAILSSCRKASIKFNDCNYLNNKIITIEYYSSSIHRVPLAIYKNALNQLKVDPSIFEKIISLLIPTVRNINIYQYKYIIKLGTGKLFNLRFHNEDGKDWADNIL